MVRWNQVGSCVADFALATLCFFSTTFGSYLGDKENLVPWQHSQTGQSSKRLFNLRPEAVIHAKCCILQIGRILLKKSVEDADFSALGVPAAPVRSGFGPYGRLMAAM